MYHLIPKLTNFFGLIEPYKVFFKFQFNTYFTGKAVRKVERSKLRFVMDFCDAGDMNDFLLTRKPNAKLNASFIRQLANGVAFLHDNRVVHRYVDVLYVFIVKYIFIYFICVSIFGTKFNILHIILFSLIVINILAKRFLPCLTSFLV